MIDWSDIEEYLARLMWIGFVVLILALGIAASRAHEAMAGWQYPWECCHNLDCSEIDAKRVRMEGGGYVVDEVFHVPFSEVKTSPDGRYHACFPNPHFLRCFFAPPMGS